MISYDLLEGLPPKQQAIHLNPYEEVIDGRPLVIYVRFTLRYLITKQHLHREKYLRVWRKKNRL